MVLKFVMERECIDMAYEENSTHLQLTVIIDQNSESILLAQSYRYFRLQIKEQMW